MTQFRIDFTQIWALDRWRQPGQPIVKLPLSAGASLYADITVHLNGVALVPTTGAQAEGSGLTTWCELLGDFLLALEESPRAGYTLESEVLGQVSLKVRRAGAKVRIQPNMDDGRSSPPVGPFELALDELNKAIFDFRDRLHATIKETAKPAEFDSIWRNLWDDDLL